MKEPHPAVQKFLLAATALLIASCIGAAAADSLAPQALPAYLTVRGETEAAGVYLVNINTDGPEQLRELPGIGDVLSERIVEYRETHGPYARIEDLTNVTGISERMLENLRGLITC